MGTYCVHTCHVFCIQIHNGLKFKFSQSLDKGLVLSSTWIWWYSFVKIEEHFLQNLWNGIKHWQKLIWNKSFYKDLCECLLMRSVDMCMCLCSSTFAHVLCDDVNGLLRNHSVKLHQLVVAEFLHDLSLFQEGLRGHGARLQSLHCHFSGAIPRSWHMHTHATISTAGTSIHIPIDTDLTILPSNLKTWFTAERQLKLKTGRSFSLK